jgi:hypothetical protein
MSLPKKRVIEWIGGLGLGSFVLGMLFMQGLQKSMQQHDSTFLVIILCALLPLWIVSNVVQGRRVFKLIP